jgi:hypothetical protein
MRGGIEKAKETSRPALNARGEKAKRSNKLRKKRRERTLQE